MKYCKNCTWFRVDPNSQLPVPTDMYAPECKHPKAQCSEDVVFGTMSYYSCAVMRNSICGIDAIMYEENSPGAKRQ